MRRWARRRRNDGAQRRSSHPICVGRARPARPCASGGQSVGSRVLAVGGGCHLPRDDDAASWPSAEAQTVDARRPPGREARGSCRWLVPQPLSAMPARRAVALRGSGALPSGKSGLGGVSLAHAGQLRRLWRRVLTGRAACLVRMHHVEPEEGAPLRLPAVEEVAVHERLDAVHVVPWQGVGAT